MAWQFLLVIFIKLMVNSTVLIISAWSDLICVGKWVNSDCKYLATLNLECSPIFDVYLKGLGFAWTLLWLLVIVCMFCTCLAYLDQVYSKQFFKWPAVSPFYCLIYHYSSLLSSLTRLLVISSALCSLLRKAVSHLQVIFHLLKIDSVKLITHSSLSLFLSAFILLWYLLCIIFTWLLQ